MSSTTQRITAAELKQRFPRRFEQEYNAWAYNAPDYDWWDFVVEDAKEDGAEIGFEIDDIKFSGFWSQGDGACWTGSINLMQFISARHADDADYFVIRHLMNEGCLEGALTVHSRGHYSHSGTMCLGDVDTDLNVPSEYTLQFGVMAGANAAAIYYAAGGDARMSDLATEALQEAKDFADDIYEKLEAEYTYLTSEEQFIESCWANDVMFDIDDGDDE